VRQRQNAVEWGMMSQETAKPPLRLSYRTMFLLISVAGVIILLAYLGMVPEMTLDGDAQAATSRFELDDIPFNGARAFEYLEQLCALGRRPSGSEGMAAQQELLEDHFKKLGATVHRQEFRVRHPLSGNPVAMCNLIAQWHPERKQRILLCAHYDTLPYPMLDPVDRQGVFVGANDGGSGVALLMEMAHELTDLLADDQTQFGVDLVMLDGEEFIFEPKGRYFLGSEYFARSYAAGNLPYQGRYRWGILLDMIGDADLGIKQEANSFGWRDTRPLVFQIWATARRLQVREFIPEKGKEILDDHVPLHNIGGIPICDLIDFDYPPWHTREDTPDKCSALSLAKVGWVVREWLKTANSRDR
jgi:glutaminyl-peptide cyclotransferase